MAEFLKPSLSAEEVAFLVRSGRPPIRILGPQNGRVEYAIPPQGASFLGTRKRTESGLEFFSRDGKSRGFAEMVEVDSSLAPAIDAVRDNALRELGIKPVS